MPIQTAAVLLTCHNRREITLASLGALFRQRRIGDLETEVFLFDDGCTDGTGEAVRSRFPSVNVLHGDGSFYWNGGMRHALAFAMNLGFDAYILMNDDTMLYPDALQRVVSLARQRIAARAPAIVGGSTLSRLTGEQSYGGLLKKLRGPAVDLHMVKAHPSMPVECHTMHGNFALIPAEIVAAIGPLDDQFQHQFGDLDFGLRATAAGFSVIAVPGIVGDCSANPIEGTWRDRSLGLVERWRHLTSPKGVPFKEWILFTRRHYGWRWLTYACSPYIKTLFTSMLPKPRKTASVKLAMEEGLCEN